MSRCRNSDPCSAKTMPSRSASAHSHVGVGQDGRRRGLDEAGARPSSIRVPVADAPSGGRASPASSRAQAASRSDRSSRRVGPGRPGSSHRAAGGDSRRRGTRRRSPRGVRRIKGETRNRRIAGDGSRSASSARCRGRGRRPASSRPSPRAPAPGAKATATPPSRAAGLTVPARVAGEVDHVPSIGTGRRAARRCARPADWPRVNVSVSRSQRTWPPCGPGRAGSPPPSRHRGRAPRADAPGMALVLFATVHGYVLRFHGAP